MEKIYIIDAVNFLFRSYYAIGPMTNKDGVSTSALFGFIRSIKKLIEDFSPKYLVAVFDGPDNKVERQKIYEDYKAHRVKAPDDLYPQFEMAENFCKLFGIKTLCIQGIEADDAMASIAKFAKNNSLISYICTSDKDLMQMVDDKTFVLQTHKNNELFDAKKVFEKFKVYPNQILDYLSIVGDTSDNIPGIEGFGPKTAADLLASYNTLDNIFENAQNLSEKKKLTLLSQKQKALLSKKLATLNLNVNIPKELDAYKLQDPNLEKLEEFYQKMNFSTLLKDLKKTSPIVQQTKEVVNYKLINSEKDFLELIDNLKKQKEIVIDTETTSLEFMKAQIIGIGFCIEKAKAYYVPLNGNLNENFILSLIKDLLEDENISFVGHNIKYDYHIFQNYSIEIKNISFDTILASYLINPQNRKHSLDTLAFDKYGKIKIPIKDLIGQGKKQISMKDVPLENVCNYCSEDVDYTFRLKEDFKKEIENKDLSYVFYEIEMPLLKILAKMERAGIFVDKNLLAKMSLEITQKVKRIEGEIFSEAGKKFNISSPKQLGEVLYVDLALPFPKAKASSFSTAANVLEKLKGKSPIIDHILQFREYQKLLTTYIDAIPKLINPDTNRVHSTFSQSTTATGRLASKDPNLQNIPIKSEEGKKIREGFKAQKESWFYLSADYSQIELKFLAHFSNDENLIKAFNQGDDIHSYTASLINDVPIDEVTRSMRSQAKAVNFGIVYGQSSFGLSEQLGITPKKAKEFIDKYFERYPSISNYLKICKEEVKKNKVSFTITKRQRPIHEIDNKNPIIKMAAERLAINTPLQGSAADLIKLAMIAIDKEIKKQNLKGYMILQIHDELLFEIPQDEIDIFKKMVKEKMETAMILKVPLTVDIEVGKSLAEC